jgi:hypothetical protein
VEHVHGSTQSGVNPLFGLGVGFVAVCNLFKKNLVNVGEFVLVHVVVFLCAAPLLRFDGVKIHPPTLNLQVFFKVFLKKVLRAVFQVRLTVACRKPGYAPDFGRL